MDWNYFTNALVILCLPALVVLAVRVLMRYWYDLKVRRPDLTALLEKAAVMAVNAAEQLGGADTAEEKLQYAYNVVAVWLDQYGIDLDEDLIIAAIEAAVRVELNYWRNFEPTDGAPESD